MCVYVHMHVYNYTYICISMYIHTCLSVYTIYMEPIEFIYTGWSKSRFIVVCMGNDTLINKQ